MQNLARKLTPEPVTLDEGTIVAVKDGAFTVRTGDFDCTARRARSCLVAPQVGDEVLVSFGREGRCFVLAVLDSAPEVQPGATPGATRPTTIEVDGDLDVRVSSGKLGLRAARGVSVTSGDELNLVGKALSVSALEGTVFVQQLAYLGSRFKAEVEAIKTVGSVCDAVFERVSQRVKRSFRAVEDLDQLKAGKVDYAAETTMSLRAEHAVVHAEELVKVDAKQIQLG
ncbi:DUF3540 domain-containing protein [Chondromyces apiculatus]|uniref:DUF3540 domain-containing protein n=1 Tax=Chondromyces apiculatus DSM 436 TaxID=1192034 RepID=A0A017T7A1_9BACT|nr:DUF3540 domain-containing protein [Chondromyces apiculatus]EYF05089.1 Hypothetical protein CAP_3679 [Chondromyces apiculatus DSM 436]